MADLNILLEPAVDGQLTATVLEFPEFKVTANTRQLALDEIQQLLVQRLAQTEIVSVSVPTKETDNPWIKFGGIFKGDPDFEAIAQAMKVEREDLL
ncbi:MAG: hypothetical protein AAGE59_09785 [Cyanobacteria bacterium P01_F01_bin.86]